MRKNHRLLNICEKIISIVILPIFLTFPVYGEPLTELPPNSTENETKLYSDSEVESLIEELTEAALEAIEKAAAEAARAAALANLETEAAAWRESQRWRLEAENAKRAGIKNAVIAGVVCFLGGFIIGFSINN